MKKCARPWNFRRPRLCSRSRMRFTTSQSSLSRKRLPRWKPRRLNPGSRPLRPFSNPIAIPSPDPSQSLHLRPIKSSNLTRSTAEPSVALRDPGLVESPAVHVTPEPLLVDSEESHGPSEYGARKQEVPPLHSFFAPASGDPVVEEPNAAESSTREEIAVPIV